MSPRSVAFAAAFALAGCQKGHLAAVERQWTLRIVPTRSSAKHGTQIDVVSPGSGFYVVLSNTSGSDLSVWSEWCSWGYHSLSFEIALDDGAKFVIKKKPKEWFKNYADPYIVKSGSHFVSAVRFDRSIWDGFPKDWKNQKAKITAVFEITPDAQTKRLKVWTGRIVSPRVEAMIYR